ncbi:MAG: hypothetical protein HY727_16835 [Candidatus Rokubacteria bacterium]|nr:hypothetical protein [Candidatus Rokubacteria bacterium]
MPTGRRALALVLIGTALLVPATSLAHAHDASGPAIYATQCPLEELGGQTAALALAAPSPAHVDVVAPAVLAAPDGRATPAVVSPASPRAPPSR